MIINKLNNELILFINNHALILTFASSTTSLLSVTSSFDASNIGLASSLNE